MSNPLEELADWSKINFDYNRFWSSPPKLPTRNIIGVVLAQPTTHDVLLILEIFGLHLVKIVFEEIKATGELSQVRIEYNETLFTAFEYRKREGDTIIYGLPQKHLDDLEKWYKKNNSQISDNLEDKMILRAKGARLVHPDDIDFKDEEND